MRALLLMLALFSTSLWAGEVYRSVGPDGTVTYSDVPTGNNAQPIFILVPRAASEPRSSASTPSAAAPAAQPGGDDLKADSDAKPGAPGQAAKPDEKEKAKNCEIARDRAQRYSEAHRLYKTGANGEREYLTDAEIDEARAQAAAAVDRWCK